MSTHADTLPMDDSQIKALAKKKGLSEEELLTLARSTFGSIGGRAGTGNSKKRDPAHYKLMVQKRNEKRAAKRAAAGAKG